MGPEQITRLRESRHGLAHGPTAVGPWLDDDGCVFGDRPLGRLKLQVVTQLNAIIEAPGSEAIEAFGEVVRRFKVTSGCAHLFWPHLGG